MRHARPIPALLALLAACGGNHRPVVPPGPPVEHPTPAEILAAGELITEVNTRERLTIISHDSMGGRNTPSLGLEKTAAYLASNYAAWGLKPAGDNGSFFQRYTLAQTRVNPAASWIELREGGRTTRYPLGTWGYPSNFVTPTPVTGSAIIVAGPVVTADVANADVKGRVVVFVQDSARAAVNALVLRALRDRQPAALVVLRNNLTRAQIESQIGMIAVGLVGVTPSPAPVPTLFLHDSLWADAGAPLRPDWNALRRSPTAIIRPAPPGFEVSIYSQRDTLDRVTAPNVVALLEGSDSVLKHEYIVFSSHMDHIGTVGDGIGNCAPFTRPDGSVDTICNGADDDGSGTTGVLSVAQAFASLKVKPKRSVIFLNVSGEEKGLLGSAWFAQYPAVPAARIVANVNMDMIGRNATDSIVVIGKEHSDMGITLARVQAAHPELGLVASDDIWPEEGFYGRSDHFNFAKKGVPVLFFFNGTHPQYHRPNDEVGLIDFSKLSRVARLGFYFGVEMAMTPEKPKWNPESYDLIVTQQKTPPVPPRPAPTTGGRP